MPIYDYKCKNCDILIEGWNKIADRHDSPKCECGSDTELTIVSPSNVNPDIEPFQCLGFDHDGGPEDSKTKNPKYFRSRRHMNDELRAHGLSIANSKSSRWI